MCPPTLAVVITAASLQSIGFVCFVQLCACVAMMDIVSDGAALDDINSHRPVGKQLDTCIIRELGHKLKQTHVFLWGHSLQQVLIILFRLVVSASTLFASDGA